MGTGPGDVHKLLEELRQGLKGGRLDSDNDNGERTGMKTGVNNGQVYKTGVGMV